MRTSENWDSQSVVLYAVWYCFVWWQCCPRPLEYTWHIVYPFNILNDWISKYIWLQGVQISGFDLVFSQPDAAELQIKRSRSLEFGIIGTVCYRDTNFLFLKKSVNSLFMISHFIEYESFTGVLFPKTNWQCLNLIGRDWSESLCREDSNLNRLTSEVGHNLEDE